MPLLIALDIDGTTVHHDGHLSERVRDAVRKVIEAGHHVVMATGRTVGGTLPIARELGVRGRAVCCNGAVQVRYDDSSHELTDVVTFDPRPALSLIRRELPDVLVAVEGVHEGHKVSAPFPDGELMSDQTVVPWEELVSEPVTRVTVRQPGSTAEDFLEMTERIGLHGVNYAVGFTAWLDINPEGVSKGSALEQLRRELHVEPADTVAVGDQRNDLEMLRWAARGVAMGQAPDEVVEAADETTAAVEDDGLALVLESLL